MRMPADRFDEFVDADAFDPADVRLLVRDFPPNVFEIRMGVSYFTNEKLFDALVVIFLLK